MVVETAFRPANPTLRRAYGVAATAFLLVFVAWTRATWLGPLATRWFVDITSTLIPLGVGALAIARARHLPSERRSAWFLLGAAVLAWALGNMAWSYLELWAQRGIPVLERTVPFPSLADVGYLLLIPLAASALLIMVVGGTAVTTRMRTLLDGLLIASAMLFLGWALVLRPIVHYAIQQEGVLAQLVSLAYPMGDIVLLSLLILVATRVDRPVQASLAWLGLGLMCFTLADIGFWVQVAQGTYQTGSWSDPGWVAGFLIIGYAGLRPLPVVAQGVPRRPAWSSPRCRWCRSSWPPCPRSTWRSTKAASAPSCSGTPSSSSCW